MKQITFCRHAKAVNCEQADQDFERSLSKRGKADITKMAQRFSKNQKKPGLIISSAAARAKETAILFGKGVGVKKNKIDFRQELYEQDVPEIIQLLKALPDDVGHVLIVGHNPVMEDLAQNLIRGFASVLQTSALVSATFKVKSWKGLGAGLGKATYFDFPGYSTAQLDKLSAFQTDLRNSIRTAALKKLSEYDTEAAGELEPSIKKMSSIIVANFTKKIKKRRKFVESSKG